MTRRPIILSAAAATLAAAALVTTACGGSDSSSSSTTAPATTSAGAAGSATAGTTPGTTTAPSAVTTTAVRVLMGKPTEYSLVPSKLSVPSGNVTFTVTNKGQIEHEMVVVPSPGGAQSLKQPDGTASETGSPGEAGDVTSGETKTVTINLPPGRYTLLCNLPGHFAAGMYSNFKVS